MSNQYIKLGQEQAQANTVDPYADLKARAMAEAQKINGPKQPKHWYSNLKYIPQGAAIGGVLGGNAGVYTGLFAPERVGLQGEPLRAAGAGGLAGGAIGTTLGGIGGASLSSLAYLKDYLTGEKYAYVNLGTKAAQYNGWSDANKMRLGGGLAGAGIGGLASYLGGGSALKGGLAGGALGYGAAEAYNHRDQIDPIVQGLIAKLKSMQGGQQELQGPANPQAESQFNGGASLGPGPQ